MGLSDWWRRWRGEWRLEGWDTFGGHSYPIPGRYRTREHADAAARRRLKKLERTQPSETSGGQDGIQDQVYVVGPAGERYRVR
jgi:hypothetical protein